MPTCTEVQAKQTCNWYSQQVWDMTGMLYLGSLQLGCQCLLCFLECHNLPVAGLQLFCWLVLALHSLNSTAAFLSCNGHHCKSNCSRLDLLHNWHMHCYPYRFACMCKATSSLWIEEVEASSQRSWRQAASSAAHVLADFKCEGRCDQLGAASQRQSGFASKQLN